MDNNKKTCKKKDLSGPMASGYDPVEVEKEWYNWWMEKGYFTVDNTTENKRGKFVMVIPPPNVTGSLHIGHALTISIEDAVTRWHRMCGRDALWIPGTDHAGIATQVVVEKKLMREENKSRYDYGREEFVNRVWKWKEVYGGRITDQIKRMGASVDWSRESFTMDSKLSKAVTEAFVKMHENGKIFRSTRLVNWSCALQSAISNIEVDYEEFDKRKKLDVPGYSDGVVCGGITSFAYKVKGSDEEIIVATTRPETMLGDTAVAVHPDDQRYKHLIGKELVHPFIEDRKVIIVADSILVDMTFGTGAVKVTPAHDPNDFECGKRHKLEFINILTDDGHINENGGKFKGMKRFDARIEVIKGLKELKLFKETKDNKMSIGVCSRSKDIIEPLLKPQWYVDLREPAKRSIEAFNNGDLKIYPSFLSSDWNRWLEKTEDWCISRQLWWGHRIPAYLIWPKDQAKPDSENIDNWFIARTREEAIDKACKKLNRKLEELQVEQDEDVLDTWFSSGLFPFSVFGWPDNTQDLKSFYPGTLLETGRDILFFWVAKMVMMGLELTDQLPFKDVFLHAMVRDSSGRKMSKSLGNVVDPIDVIEGITLEEMQKQLQNSNLGPNEIERALKDQKENFKNGIKQCGTDALRFGLCDYTSHGRDINLETSVIESYRNWCNKLWNVTKFALGVLGDNFKPNKNLVEPEHLIDQWILSRLSVAVKITNKAFKTYSFALATRTLYHFWMSEFCDVYIEAIKPIVYGKKGIEHLTEEENKNRQVTLQTLYTCLEVGLKLLHPFMPFITEELYQRLPSREGAFESIMIAPYPQILQTQINEHPLTEENFETEAPSSTFYKPTVEREFEYMEKINKEIRAAKSMYMKGNIKKQDPRVFVNISNPEKHDCFARYKSYSNTLVWCSDIQLLNDGNDKEGCSLTVVDENTKVYVELSELGLDYSAEITRLQNNLKKLQLEYKKLLQKMGGKMYTEKVPLEVQEQDAKKKISLEAEERLILNGIEQFKKLAEKKN